MAPSATRAIVIEPAARRALVLVFNSNLVSFMTSGERMEIIVGVSRCPERRLEAVIRPGVNHRSNGTLAKAVGAATRSGGKPGRTITPACRVKFSFRRAGRILRGEDLAR